MWRVIVEMVGVFAGALCIAGYTGTLIRRARERRDNVTRSDNVTMIDVTPSDEN